LGSIRIEGSQVSEQTTTDGSLLNRIESPADLRGLAHEELGQVCGELREYIIDVVTRIGGHFGSSLGAVELTVALHHVFDTPQDRIVWDVGHQAYGHKVLTGRRDALQQIRQKDGISGFPNRRESVYDTFGVGHAGTSISAALGFATMRDLLGDTFKVIAVIGDGAITSGLAFEGLNNAGASNRDLLVVLNDNRMAISPSVGAISHYLTRIISDPAYNRLRERITNDPLYRKIKDEVWGLTGRIPVIGDSLRRAIGGFEEGLKGMLVPGVVFEEMGFRYFGPIDGHDVGSLVQTLKNVREVRGPVLLHIHTIKGQGAIRAEEDPFGSASTKYHALSAPKPPTSGPSLPRYQDVFGRTLTELAQGDDRICAITAAMAEGTGLDIFAEAHPDRFFDVGIAEQHAVTFSGGLVLEGGRPVVAIYSTFLQRAYDQIIHDVALQSLPVVFCLDRAGLVGEDGPTHHGAFDLSYLLCIPGMVISAPKDGEELRDLLFTALVQEDSPFAIRYPRDAIPRPLEEGRAPQAIDIGTWELLADGVEVALLAVGSAVELCLEAREHLAVKGTKVCVVNCRFVKPMDERMLGDLCDRFRVLVTVEENAVEGGFGTSVERHVAGIGRTGVTVRRLGLADRFYPHGPRNHLLAQAGLSPELIADTVRTTLGVSPEIASVPRALSRPNGQG
jgi:1-deoxy-D-xylulose-5-phosphate synthase